MDRTDLFGDVHNLKTTLQGKFIVPPFSVLDARQGYWQRRKRQWIKLGIQSELGRSGEMPGGSMWPDSKLGKDGKFGRADLHMGKMKKSAYERKGVPLNKLSKVYGSGAPGDLNKSYKKNTMEGKSNLLGHPDTTGDLTFYKQKREAEKKIGHSLSLEEFREKYYAPAEGEIHSGTSIFDPVLTELMYRWFCPDNGKILDPFAGGSVRGIVANILGYDYTGIELREEQVVANVEQGHKILSDNIPKWICGNSRDVCSLVKTKKHFDFIFSCPPYYNLEVYSDLKGELSNYKNYKSFLHHYKIIIARCLSLLKNDRFACFVVSNIRDKQGFYLNFCNDTVDAFQKFGAYFYNEIILVTAIGSLPIRVGRQFTSGRKIGKTHQNILVFYKGNPKNIKEKFPQKIRSKK